MQGKLANVYYEVGYKVDSTKLDSSEKKVEKLEKAVETINRKKIKLNVDDRNIEKQEKKMSSLGSFLKYGRMAGVGVVAGAVAYQINEATKVYANLEEQLLKVNAKGDMTQATFERLKEATIETSLETKKYKPVEVAKGLEYMAMAGWSADQSIKALKPAMNLVTATGEELTTVTDILTDQMTVFGISADKAGHFTDVLAYSANKANTTVGQMGEALKYAGAPAKALGMSVEETSAILMGMADGGIKGSQAGTTLRSALLRLVNPSKEANFIMKKLGIEIKDKTTGSFVGMANIMEQLEQKTKKYTNVQRAQIYATLFGQEAISGMNTILEQGTEKLRKNTRALKDNANYTQKVADYVGKSMNGTLKETEILHESLSVKIGETFGVAKRELVGEYNKKLLETYNLLKDNQEELNNLQYAMVGLAQIGKKFGGGLYDYVKSGFEDFMNLQRTTLNTATFGLYGKAESYAIEGVKKGYEKLVEVGKVQSYQRMGMTEEQAKEFINKKYLKTTWGENVGFEVPKLEVPKLNTNTNKISSSQNIDNSIGNINITINGSVDNGATTKLSKEIKLELKGMLEARDKKLYNLINPEMAIQ